MTEEAVVTNMSTDGNVKTGNQGRLRIDYEM